MHLQAEHSTHINVTSTIPTEMYLQRLCRIRWGHSKLQWLPQSVVCRHLPGQGSRNSNCDVSDPFYSPMTAQGPQCIANHVLPGNGEPLPDPGMALISNILCTGKACHLRGTSHETYSISNAATQEVITEQTSCKTRKKSHSVHIHNTDTTIKDITKWRTAVWNIPQCL